MLAVVVIVIVLAVSGLALCAMRSKVGLKVNASLLKLASLSIEVESRGGNQGGELPPTGRRQRYGESCLCPKCNEMQSSRPLRPRR